MTIYSVHLPADGAASASVAEKAHFERQGFSWRAFVFGPLWLLARGLWLAILAWCLLALLVGLAVGYDYLPAGAAGGLMLLAAIYIGFEGRSLADAAMERSGWRLVDVALGDRLVDAERGFFLRWPGETAPPPPPRPIGPPPPAHVIGLFPEAGG